MYCDAGQVVHNRGDCTASQHYVLPIPENGKLTGLVPLIVPITLLNHYVRKYDEPYLREQVYLHPHPVELKLRNHV